MSNRKVIVIVKNSNAFEPLFNYLSSRDIIYQHFEDFESYLKAHDYKCRFLLASANDLIEIHKQKERFCRSQYNSTYILAYEHSHQLDRLKTSLAIGADDFITLPYDPELIGLKIESQFKHIKYLEALYQADQSAIVYKNMTIDPFSKQIYLKNQRLELTQSEFNILYTLAKNPNEVYNMEYLFHMITGQKSLGDYNALMTHVSRLRKKLSQVDTNHHYIITVRNRGYKFNPNVAELY